MKRDYLSDPQYNYESVNRASKACGPLVKWAIAQVFTGAHEKSVQLVAPKLLSLEAVVALVHVGVPLYCHLRHSPLPGSPPPLPSPPKFLYLFSLAMQTC